jgi:AraC family transcriptional activator of pobA
MHTAPVPRYHLYGENDQADDFDFFHIETIRARSAPLGWSLDAHSHIHLFQCLMITSGEGRLTDDTGDRRIAPDTVVFTPPGVVHGWEFTPDTQGYVVSFTHDYLAGSDDGRDLDRLLAGQGETNHLVTPSGDDRLKVCRYLQEMAEEFESGKRRRLVFRPLMTLMLARMFAGTVEGGEIDAAPGFSLFRFRALVDAHFRTERAPEFYAAEMGMPVARLNRYCRLFTDRTATQSIRDRIVLEAKRQLAFSSVPVSEIAYDLGFDDPAYFSRVFRKETGESPQDFRNRQKA